MIILLAIGGGVLLSFAIIVRELAVARERSTAIETAHDLRRHVDQLRSALQHTSDELTVLRAALEQRQVIDDRELARMRARLRGSSPPAEEPVPDENESVH